MSIGCLLAYMLVLSDSSSSILGFTVKCISPIEQAGKTKPLYLISNYGV